MDLHARFEAADKKLNDVPNLVSGVGVVMWAVEGLNDSHTIFAPPARNVIVFSGWEMGMVGENCMITAVQSGSDAWEKGLRPGDQVMRGGRLRTAARDISNRWICGSTDYFRSRNINSW